MEQCQTPLTKRGYERHERILEAAGEVFAEQGYAGASINEIVRRSGGSLGTVYKFFGNKLGLFEAYFQKTTCTLFSQFHADEFWTDNLQDSLTKFGREMQALMFQPNALLIYRLVLNDNSGDQADVQRIFLENGPQKITRVLSNYLRNQSKKHDFQIEDYDLAAYQFIEMIKGPMYFKALFGHSVCQQEREQALAQATRIFLKGIMPC
ncbi:TetR/AcrR family transcriptional regulator [Thiomicrospira sp.]|uniref:TetR/AcrR family transcriptional regulator n=1 Tax=Thiomicrospira sp. TaxID=935 RepID=UPI002F95F250